MFRFNYLRVFTQDYILGKTISMTMSLVQMAILAVRQPSRKLFNLFGVILVIKPKYSMLATVRLLNLYYLAQKTDRLHLRGDVVECGVCNGGAAAMVGRAFTDLGKWSDHTMWLYDSFEGCPPPSEKDSKAEVKNYFVGICKGKIENVQTIFKKLDVSMDNVKIVKGWLEDTLPKNTIKDIVLLHVDTDWYKCVKPPLDFFYDKVVPGGFVVIDDYWFHKGCKAAVHDFLTERNLNEKVQLKKVDRSAVYFQKPM